MSKAEFIDNEELLKKIDRSGMLSAVSQTPEMLLQAERISAGVSLPRPGKISQVLVAGMGGSAIAGDILSDLFLKKAAVPLQTMRNYNLPGFVGPETLLFALSYSGDTEEVLSVVREAEGRKAKIICVTSGGKLKEIAENKRYPLFLIPGGYQPRAALPYLLIPLIVCLGKFEVVPLLSEELKETVALLRRLQEEYGFHRPLRSNPAKQLAKKLAGKIPFIFGCAGTTGAAALRMKTQFNENGKVTAIINLFPELDHNELVNISFLKRDNHNFSLIVLRDEEDSERMRKRIEITKSLITRQLGGAIEIVSQGRSPLARSMSLIFFGDYVSVYLALQQQIDPTPVDVISRLKKELTR